MIALPFSPQFFKKLDMYQELKNFESERDIHDHNWEVEKYILFKVSNPGYLNPRSSSLNTGHIASLRSEGIKKGKFKNPATSLSNDLVIANNLVSRDLAEKSPFFYATKEISINQRGFIAGKVLAETNSLVNPEKYEGWIKLWNIAFIATTVALFSTSLLTLINLLEKVCGLLILFRTE